VDAGQWRGGGGEAAVFINSEGPALVGSDPLVCL
jgi:hypothetical protein